MMYGNTSCCSKVLSVQVEQDFEDNTTYVSMKDPTAPDIAFVRTPCSSKQVLKVACADLGEFSYNLDLNFQNL